MKKKYMIFTVIIFICVIILILSDKKPNEEFIVFCKKSPNSLNVFYVNSLYGIRKINKKIEGDSIELSIRVNAFITPKEVTITYDDQTKYVLIGKKTYEISQFGVCKDEGN